MTAPGRVASPVTWRCKGCDRLVHPTGLHTCDETGRVVDGHGTVVTATVETCRGAFAVRPEDPEDPDELWCVCDAGELDHDQVEVADAG